MASSSQVQGPPPTITEVIPSNQSLLVKWAQETYTLESDDATLLYIDTATNEMFSVLLTTEQIMNDEYQLTGLVNGHTYAILFSCLYDDGVTHNSNTVTSIPCNVPNAPIINSFTLVPAASYTTVNVNVTLGSNGGSNITSVVFRVFNIDLNNVTTITTQAFAPSQDGNYILTGFVLDEEYIISCQAQNIAGYSMVSNSVSFINAAVPAAPLLGVIQSGVDGEVTLNVSGFNSSPNITGFNVQYKLSSSTIWIDYPVANPITSSQYNISIDINGLTNASQGYSFKVAAVNTNGISLYSSPQNAEPALKLAFSDAAVSFPAANQIQANWSRNVPSWPTTGTTEVTFSGTSTFGSFSQTIVLANSGSPVSSTYTLTSGSLVAGNTYTITLNGYTFVPQDIYEPPNKYWVEPTLTDLRFPAVEVTATDTYATVPGPVTNIVYTTDIIDGLGAIQFAWTEAADNGSPIVNYTCQLYTVSGGVRTLYGSPTSTTAENCLFGGLNVSLFYAVGITANNEIGSGPTTYDPAGASGIVIVDAVAPVTFLKGSQQSYTLSPTSFTGLLTWKYNGPGTGYTGTTYFDIYEVSNTGAQILLIPSVEYVTGTIDYQYPVDLGTTANVTFNYAVQVRTSSPASLSTKEYVSITTGVAPIISGVVVAGTTGVPESWTLTFTVTNSTTSSMVPNSINALVMPNPIVAIEAGIYPLFTGDEIFDSSLVGVPGQHTYTIALGYEAISNDYVFITAANLLGSSIYASKWGTV